MVPPSANAPCLFCRIAAGEVPAHIVYQDDRILAFLDIHPIRPGHLQIIPRRHFPYFDALPPDLGAEILLLGQRCAGALKRITGAPRVGFLFTGGDIAHAHAHVVPLHAADDITSARYIEERRLTYRDPPRPSDAALSESASALRALLGDQA